MTRRKSRFKVVRATPAQRAPESKLLSSRGGSRRWGKIAKQVADEERVCWLQLPGFCTGRSQTADHFYPRSTHPHLAEVRSNLRGACIPCNRRRGNIQPGEIDKLREQLAKKHRNRMQPPPALRFFG